MRERLKTKEFRNTKKKKNEYRILALDQATHISGYAVFSNKNLIDYILKLIYKLIQIICISVASFMQLKRLKQKG